MLNQIYATKKSMAQAFVGGKRIPLTVLSVEPHIVVRNKTVEKDGYASIVFSIGKKVKEVLSGETPEVKSEINLQEILVPGATINVSAVSKGKGFSGVVKRWGFAGGPRTHGQSDRLRAPGSIARGTTPGRVVPGKHMAGRMGNQLTSVKNLKIHSYDPETRVLQITGAIAGGRGALARITITKQFAVIPTAVEESQTI